MTTRQFARLLSPLLRHYGGCSRVCRRSMWRKSRKTVAVPVFAAVQFGDKMAKVAQPDKETALTF